jgi:hypothetical protein
VALPKQYAGRKAICPTCDFPIGVPPLKPSSICKEEASRKRKKDASISPEGPLPQLPERPSGMGGWLLFFAVILVGNLLLSVVDLHKPEIYPWHIALFGPKLSYGVAYALYYANLAILVCWTYGLALFFSKKASAPKAVRALLGTDFAVMATTILWIWWDVEWRIGVSLVGISFGFTLTWTFYLSESVRVKNTFVR